MAKAKWYRLGIRVKCPKHNTNAQLYAKVLYNRAYLYARHGRHYCYLETISRDELDDRLKLSMIAGKYNDLVEVKIYIKERFMERLRALGDVRELLSRFVDEKLEEWLELEELAHRMSSK